MTSIAGIVNLGLFRLGQKAIVDLSQNTKAARVATLQFPAIRDAVLRSHPWNCATRRVALAAEADAPVFGPAYSYVRLPDDLRVLEVKDEKIYKWRSEGRRIVTDQAAPLYVRYIQRITDPNDYDALLISAIADHIAWDLAMPMTMKRSVADAMEDAYNTKLVSARSADGQEGSTRKVEASEWLESRRSGVGDPHGGEEPWA